MQKRRLFYVISKKTDHRVFHCESPPVDPDHCRLRGHPESPSERRGHGSEACHHNTWSDGCGYSGGNCAPDDQLDQIQYPGSDQSAEDRNEPHPGRKSGLQADNGRKG